METSMIRWCGRLLEGRTGYHACRALTLPALAYLDAGRTWRSSSSRYHACHDDLQLRFFGSPAVGVLSEEISDTARRLLLGEHSATAMLWNLFTIST